jgi:hypothetical protein
MKGRKIFGRLSVHGVIWQLAFVSIVTAVLLDRVVSVGVGGVIA